MEATTQRALLDAAALLGLLTPTSGTAARRRRALR